MWTKKRNVILWALLCCALWASATPFIKTGYALMSIEANDTPSILVFAGSRFALSGVLVWMAGKWMYKDQIKFESSMIQAICVLALFQTFGQYFFYYIGLAHTSGVNGSIISGMNSFFSLLLACFIFRYEKMNRYKIIGCLLGFLGILWMNRQGIEGHLIGDGFVMIGQISCALSAVFIKKYTQSFHPVALSGFQFFVGGCALFLSGIIMGGHLDLNVGGFFVIVYLAFLSAVAYTIWGILLSCNPVSQVTVFSCAIPVIGVFISAFMLKEYTQAFTVDTWIALIFVTMGIYIVTAHSEKE